MPLLIADHLSLGAASSAASSANERALAPTFRQGESSLPPALLQTAKLRLLNPEVSLEELGKMCDPPVGKSGVNHRLRRLEQMAQALDKTDRS